jgi:hypothetical protein
MKIEIEEENVPLIVRALEHYGSYLKATNRGDTRYQAIAKTFKKKPVESEIVEPMKKQRKA